MERALFFQTPPASTISFSSIRGQKTSVDITFPKDYAPDNADAPGTASDPSKISLLDIRIGVSKAGGLLSYRRHFHFGGNGSVLFGVSNYPSLKGLFDAFHSADSHTITLNQK